MQRDLRPISLHLAVGFIVAVVSIAAVVCTAAWRQDHASLRTQKIIAGAETEDAYNYLRGQVRQMIYWQDAFDNIVKRRNDAWIAYQFGPYQDTMGNYLTAILGPGNELVFLHVGDKSRNITVPNFRHAKGLEALLRTVRAASVRQPPPILEGVIIVGGLPYYAVCSLVTPETPSDLALARRTPYAAIFLKPVKPAQYDGLQGGFGATQLRVVDGPRAPDDWASFPLADAQGRALVWLEWVPERPGTAFMRSAALPATGILILLALIQGLIMLRWLALQRQFITAKAEAASALRESRVKSVFLGSVSHELRTPLNAIIGFSDILLREMFGPLGSPRYSEYAGHIKQSGKCLLKSVNDMIEIARIEAHDTGTEREWIDAGLSAQRAVDAVRARAESRDVRIEFEAPDGGAWCKGSALSLTHAIERLLDNAIGNSAGGRAVHLALKCEGPCVLIEIRDEGDGIEPARVSACTRPFGQNENHLVAGPKGADLDIPIAKGLIELMAGEFSIVSGVGDGTTVRLRLPAALPETRAA